MNAKSLADRMKDLSKSLNSPPKNVITLRNLMEHSMEAYEEIELRDLIVGIGTFHESYIAGADHKYAHGLKAFVIEDVQAFVDRWGRMMAPDVFDEALIIFTLDLTEDG